MGFWDQGVSRLRSMGVPVTQEQQNGLERGGEILVLRGLVSPDLLYDGDCAGVTDQHGEQVYIPQMLHAHPPLATDLPGTHGMALNTWMDRDNRRDWRRWPSYVGEIQERSVDQQTNADGIDVVRVWDGMPLLTAADRELAEELFAAAANRVNSSVYGELCEISDFENTEGKDMEDLAPAIEGLATIVELADHLNLEPDRVETAVTAYEALLLGGYLTRSRRKEDIAKLLDLQFAPMEAYLPVNSDARRLWSRLVNRRENALAIINTGLRKEQAELFDSLERKYS